MLTRTEVGDSGRVILRGPRRPDKQRADLRTVAVDEAGQ